MLASGALGADALDVFWRDGRCKRNSTDSRDAGEDGPVIVKYEWHQRVIEDFVDAIQQGRAPMVRGREALASHRLIDAIEVTSRDGVPVAIAYCLQ